MGIVMLRKARVLEVKYAAAHQLLVCEVTEAPPPSDAAPAACFQAGDTCQAVCYPDLVGAAQPGDLVQIEVSPLVKNCLLYTSPSPRDLSTSRMPSSA